MDHNLSYGKLFEYVEEFLGERFEDHIEKDVSNLGLTVPTPTGPAPVLWMIKKCGLDIVKVTFSNGYQLRCSTKHIVVNAEGLDVFAGDLQPGATVQHIDGAVVVTDVVPDGVEDCYDIGIPSPHVYYDANGLLHHNTILTAVMSYMCEKYGRTLIIVPSKSLVTQTEKDYKNLGLDVGVFYGDRKEFGKTHTISTWQSLSALMKKGDDANITFEEFIDGVNAVIVDEVQSAKGNDLKTMLTGPLAHIPIRWGLTGTVPKDKVDQIQILIGLGPVVGHVKASDLQELGVLSNCHVNVMQLKDDHVEFKGYAEEKDFLASDMRRLEWVAELIKQKASDGNTLILVDRIEAGKSLQALLPNAVFINGAVKNETREEEYSKIQDSDNTITIATYGVAAVGINIPRIFHLVLIEPGKSFVRVIQSIGRGIRKAADKDYVDIWDIASTLKFSNRHLSKRKEFYRDANYPYTVNKIDYKTKK